jgi:hypothetical protein
MDNTVKNIKNLSLFGILPLVFMIVFVGIYLERSGFKNPLLRNVFLVLLAILAVLAIIMLYLHAPIKSESTVAEKPKEHFVAQPTCG